MSISPTGLQQKIQTAWWNWSSEMLTVFSLQKQLNSFLVRKKSIFKLLKKYFYIFCWKDLVQIRKIFWESQELWYKEKLFMLSLLFLTECFSSSNTFFHTFQINYLTFPFLIRKHFLPQFQYFCNYPVMFLVVISIFAKCFVGHIYIFILIVFLL